MNCSIFEIEVLAVIGALKKFRVHLLGIPFKIGTDYKTLQETMEKTRFNHSHCALNFTSAEMYVIKYCLGASMAYIDALSLQQIKCVYQLKVFYIK